LAKKGYSYTDIDKLPDWFLFHPRISLIIKCLKDTAKTRPEIIPFELTSIVFSKSSLTHTQKTMFPTKISVSTDLKSKPALILDKFDANSDSALAIALKEALKRIK
jgi:hypothetical protein